jgi:hypothetical protein
MSQSTCSEPGCVKPYKARGLCDTHWMRWRRAGGTPGFRGPTARPLADRLWEKVDKTATCWNWTASTSSGYGQIRLGPTFLKAHRVSYELLVGPIPDGLTLDHLCRNRRCVNPAHLDPVPIAVNIRRGLVGSWERAKTHCKNGHPFDEENTRLTLDRGKRHRRCRACGRAPFRRRRA